jgi:HEPN domain-containing protein
MVDREIIRERMMKADEDFEFALVNQLEGRPFTEQICFHFQQAAEKYLKACIVSFDLAFLKTHDLPVLLRLLCDKDPSFSQIKSECEFLNAFLFRRDIPSTGSQISRRIRPERLMQPQTGSGSSSTRS